MAMSNILQQNGQKFYKIWSIKQIFLNCLQWALYAVLALMPLDQQAIDLQCMPLYLEDKSPKPIYRYYPTGEARYYATEWPEALQEYGIEKKVSFLPRMDPALVCNTINLASY